MAKKVILGTDIARDAFKTKINDNFTELYNKDATLEGQINDLDVEVDAHKAENAIDAHNMIPACRVNNTTAQSIPNTTDTVLMFNTEIFDTDNIHDSLTNASRLTCRTAGIYMITAGVRFDFASTGASEIRVRLNGTAYISFEKQTNVNTSGVFMTLSALYNLNIGDYIELIAFQSSGSAINVQSHTYTPVYSMVKVG